MTKHYKIYELESRHSNKTYIGKTTSDLYKEMCYLNKLYNNYIKRKTTQFHYAFKILKFRDCTINKIDGITTNDINKANDLLKYWTSRTDCYNNDKIENHRNYESMHRDFLNMKKRTKHTCYCGGKYTNRSKSTHMKCNHHMKYENDIIYRNTCDINTVINMSNDINKDYVDPHILSLLVPAQLKQCQPPRLY